MANMGSLRTRTTIWDQKYAEAELFEKNILLDKVWLYAALLLAERTSNCHDSYWMMTHRG
jgi:hypothetical protein